jgi:hypothetical protein
MLRNLQFASGFANGYRHTNPAGFAESAIAGARRIATALRFAIDGWREALAACRDYEQLRSRGVPHELALREALGAGPAPSQHRCRAAQPLYFAGKA